MNTTSVSVASNVQYEGGAVPNNSDTTVYLGANTEVEPTVRLTAMPVETGLVFDGWFNGETKVFDIPDGIFSVTSNLDLIARYHSEYNGDILFDENDESSSTVAKITNYSLLVQNARSNSEQYRPKNNDGSAEWAFDGNRDHWWHTRYNGEERRPSNVFKVKGDDGTANEVICDANGTNFAPSDASPIWLQTGFDDGDDSTDDNRIIAGFSYLNRTDNGNTEKNKIGKFEIWVSDYEDMNSHRENVEVAYSGTFDTDTQRGKFIQFAKPYKAKYIRLVAYSGGDDVTASSFDIYEYTGKLVEEPVEITFNFVDETVDQEIGGFIESVTKAIVLKIQSLSDMRVAQSEFESAYIQFFDEINNYNTIAYNYDVKLNTFNPTEHTCNIIVSDAKYNLTAYIGDEIQNASGKYGEVFRRSTEEGGGLISAQSLSGFGYWEKMAEGSDGEMQGTGEKVYADEDFTLIATENVTIQAVREKIEGYAVYMPAPIISIIPGTTEGENPVKWKIEVPVTLMNVIEYTGGKNYNIKSEVTEFGVVIDKNSEPMTSDAIKSAMLGGDRLNLTVSSAYKDSSPVGSTFRLTNKGRYLHTLNVKENSVGIYNNTKIYAYAIIDGVCYLSEGKIMAFGQ